VPLNQRGSSRYVSSNFASPRPKSRASNPCPHPFTKWASADHTAPFESIKLEEPPQLMRCTALSDGAFGLASSPSDRVVVLRRNPAGVSAVAAPINRRKMPRIESLTIISECFSLSECFLSVPMLCRSCFVGDEVHFFQLHLRRAR